MLDLFRSQKKTAKYVLSAVLGLVALSMVITLIPNLFSSQQATIDDPVLVQVGDEAVTRYDVANAMRDYARSGTPAESMAFMAQQVIENLIEERVLLQEADRLGVKPSEKELALWIKEQMPHLWETGTFNSALYQQQIAQQFSITVPEFEKAVMKDLAIEMRLKELVTDNIVMTEQDLRKLFEDRNEKIKIEYVPIEASQFASQVSPTEQQIKDYFEQNKFRYRIPEQRTVKVVTVDPSSAPTPEITDAEIELYYNQNRYRFESPERVLARHILFMTTNPDDPGGKQLEGEALEAVRKKAEDALARVKAGEDFAKVAEELSEDPGTKGQGGNLGWVVRGAMVPEFEQPLFALSEGQISDVIKTPFGFHIIQAEKKDPPQVRSLEDARQEIIADLTIEKEQIGRLERVDKVMTAVRNAGDDVEAVAKEMGLPVMVLSNIDRQHPPAALGAYPRFLGDIFSVVTPGDVVSNSDEKGTMIAKVISITPSRDAELAEVADRVRADVVQSESRRIAEEKAKELYEKAKGGNLAAAARSMGLTVKTSDFFARTGGVDDFAPAQTLGDKAFAAAPGTVLGPVNAGDRFGVYAVTAKEPADPTEFLDQRDNLKAEFLEAKRNEAFGIFRGLVRQRYEKDGKITRYPERIEQLIRDIRTS
ncbi:MAG: peptidyl-prolyl cis-trans isomerase [Bryobacterales bacterium]